MLELEAIIGLEVHAQIRTRTKMFCACDNDAWGKDPNTTVCPICMGHPGTLPVPNALAVEKAVRASLALGCTVAAQCHFDRKHYFYPDLPSGFQISQYDHPLATNGYVEYDRMDGGGALIASHTCRITRLHLENDAGKLTHAHGSTLCDYNRAGTPLMEIVTEPDLRSAEEAVAFAQELRRILLSVDASEADMFKGMMRFDASISLREKGSSVLNPRSEIKNLNSFKALERALQYEEKRLRALWADTGKPLPGNITVGWQDDEGITRLLRDKENAQDYRYFPEPDIPPLIFDASELRRVQSELPPLPRVARKRYMEGGLTAAQAIQLTDDVLLQQMFDAVLEATKDMQRTSGLILTQLLGMLNASKKSTADGPSTAAMLELVQCIDDGMISANAGKEVLLSMVESGENPSEIIERKGLKRIADTDAIDALVRAGIEANPKAVESYKQGKHAALGAVVGWVMKQSAGQADPALVQKALQTIVDKGEG